MSGYSELIVRRFSLFVIFLSFVSAKATVREDLAFEQSPQTKELFYLNKKLPKDITNRSGAVGLNGKWEKDHSQPWFVELQRAGEQDVYAGLALQSQGLISWGLKQLQWGFDQQQSDGSFDCKDRFHSTSFLVEAAAHSLLLIEASAWKEIFVEEIAKMKPMLHKAALWMIQPANSKLRDQGQIIYTHRRFLVAAALGQTALLCADDALMQAANEYMRDGMQRQRNDGVFPEKGGHDSSYHAVSLIYAQRCCVVFGKDPLAAELRISINKGMLWLLTRIDPNGIVTVEGNTRTGIGQEKGRSGDLKKVNRPEVARALLYYAYFFKEPKCAEIAKKVMTDK
jgi:hypothetical protein